jgi:hypothetical protein
MNEYLVFEPLDSRLIKKAEKLLSEKGKEPEYDKHGNLIYAKIKINDIIAHELEMKQREYLGQWIENEINDLL